ncbi:Protein-S-isoprenylcysteine O-methyltransferase Ste14 [Maridesulfovibrio ferrireducens]|uniref:Protein-S-isoprenylcysteine O-methyltransferase Ste14 n=1 Tax=Maridesulfovibrio ferrireducens TaxID=246191 RepID=A0A1G9EGN3_9BACT|nr:isoprenylcysteine carboxylmethyltransferase family protein [Maridesulfovibrio ferrireducens]SDK75233.1 Protein-S-isoprenylcysteine O-methyltransferase Ste14 [Maridesulfovibrio ferrireducens]
MKKQAIPNVPETDSAGVKIMPPSIFFCCLISGITLNIFFTWQIMPENWLALLITGIIIIAAGISFMMWGHARFKSLGVNVPTDMPASQLVTDGAHQYSRNPMYVGFIAILLGLGIAVDSVWMLVSALPMTLYLSFYVIPKEEAYLLRTFGAEFKTYCKYVRKWL